MPTFDGTRNVKHRDDAQALELYKMAHKYDVQALRTACRISIMRGLQASNLVVCAIFGHLYNDDELKNAAISMMGKEIGPLKELRDWAFLEEHTALSLEIADRIKKDLFYIQ